jgi:hypothetical protein
VLRYSLAILLVLASCIITNMMNSGAADTVAQNFTEHTWIFNNGYLEDSRILQTQMGFKGQKIAMSASGSGISTRTIDSEVYSDSCVDEASFTESVDYDYRPYTPPLTQSDLRNALCAKNYAVGSVFSETYTNVRDLIKDTTVYQDQNVSIYNINSEVQGTAHIGARVQKNADTVPSFIMGGTYVGYTDIRSEIVAGNTSLLTLPCP